VTIQDHQFRHIENELGETMNKLFITLVCLIALLANAYFGYFEKWAPEEKNDKTDIEDEEDDDGDDNDDDTDPDRKELYTIEIELDEKKIIEIENDTHKITLLDINDETVLLKIESDPTEVLLRKGILEKVFLEGDYYITLMVEDITGNTVKLEIKSYEKFSVHLPPEMIGDRFNYDFELYAEMYFENYTTGNYSKYVLDSDGSWEDIVDGPFDIESGYGDKHSSVLNRYVMNGEFDITLDSTETGEVTVPGEFKADTREYTEFQDRKTIKSENLGEMKVDQLPKATIAGEVKYDGVIRYYPEPTDEQIPTISQQIYYDTTIREGDSGSIWYDGSTDLSSGQYNWTAEKKETFKVDGKEVDTMLINISSNFYFNFDFHRQAWISNEHHHIIKEIFRTNTTYEDEEGIFWMIFEERRMLLDYIIGDTEKPWKDDETAEYPTTHATGEYESWDKIPKGGHLFDDDPMTQDRIVQMAPEDALEFARENSPGLKNFMQQYPNSYIGRAKYNATLQDKLGLEDKVGTHLWNLSAQEYMSVKDAREYGEKHDKEPEKQYTLRVAKNISNELNPRTEERYKFETEIEREYGEMGGYTKFRRSELGSKGCTLSGAIDIIKTDPDAKNELFDSDSNLILKDLSILLGRGDTGESRPGTEIVQALTGLNMPYTKYTWTFQRASVYETGDTFIISVDINTGRLVQVTQITGNQMRGLFS